MEDDRIIGCLPGETPASIVAGYQALQNARLAAHVNELESALANAHARVVELERMVVWCIRHEAGLAGDDDVYLMWGDRSIMLQDDDNGLAAVEKAMGGK
jgi:hypothetical protein